MKLFNLIIVLDKDEQKVLMCYRSKEPYLGKYNLVGGKIEKGEDILNSAYRELFEETGIKSIDINLFPLMEFIWNVLDMKMFVFIGKLDKEVELITEAHELFWIDVNEDFFDMNKYAGEGNIGHMMEIYRQNRDLFFKD